MILSVKNLVLAMLICAAPCVADTFTHRSSGRTLYGYATQTKKGNTTLVITKEGARQFLPLSEYSISYDATGRKNTVMVIPIKEAIELECETAAFENAIKIASNQGPLFILLELDSPGGRVDLAKRMCAAITATNNCKVYAFVCGGKYGGAYSAAAMITLACEKVYMSENAVIGAAALIVQSQAGIQDVKQAIGSTAGAKMESAWAAYFCSVAESHGRPSLLARAMVDKDTEVVEFTRQGQTIFISPAQKAQDDKYIKHWNKSGSILTLTSADALYTHIVDEQAESEKAILVSEHIETARFIKDTVITKARREFDLAKALVKDFESTTDALAKRIKFALPLDLGSPGYKAARRDVLTDLNELIRIYKQAIPLAKKHKDLELDPAELQKNLNSLVAMYDAIP